MRGALVEMLLVLRDGEKKKQTSKQTNRKENETS